MKIKMINLSLDKPILTRISEEGVTTASLVKFVDANDYLSERISDCKTDCREATKSSDCKNGVRSDCACNSNG